VFTGESRPKNRRTAHDTLKAYLGYYWPLSTRLIASSISIAIVGTLSRFSAGHSTLAQRVWTMAWLSFGLGMGAFLASMPTMFKLFPEWASKFPIITRRGDEYDDNDLDGEKFQLISQVLTLGTITFCSAPAIGGYIVVGQMLNEYGSCIRVD
jgi:hypothetical protein